MRTFINILTTISGIVGLIFLLGSNDNVWLALIGVALFAPVGFRLEYLEQQKKDEYDNI